LSADRGESQAPESLVIDETDETEGTDGTERYREMKELLEKYAPVFKLS
jgi:hypothetical protein